MKWIEVLDTLDRAKTSLIEHPEPAANNTLSALIELRVRIRSAHGKELQSNVAEGNELAQEVLSLALPYAKLPEPKATPLDDLLACAPPEREPDVQGSKRMAAASVEGASLVIKPRPEPFIVRPPVLDDADEDSVAK